MRIGSYNSTVRYRNSINRTYEDQTKIMEMSDGNRLHRPSDDCVGYSKYLRHSVTYQENNQYQTNVQTAISWMKNTDAALVDMTSCFSKIVVKSNQADGANSDADMRAIAGEMLVQAQQAVASANTNVNGISCSLRRFRRRCKSAVSRKPSMTSRRSFSMTPRSPAM